MTLTLRFTRGEIQRGLAGIGAAIALVATGAHVAIAARTQSAPVAARAARTLSAPIRARETREVSVNDTGHLTRVHVSGEIFIEAGKVSGTLAGTASVRLDVGSETVTARFTIKPYSGGSISGTGRAKINSTARYTSFGGTLSVTGGTGRYAHAHGTGKLYGALERKSDNLTVQTREGTLHY